MSIKIKRGAKPLPKGEKKKSIICFVKTKYHNHAKKEILSLARKYNTKTS